MARGQAEFGWADGHADGGLRMRARERAVELGKGSRPHGQQGPILERDDTGVRTHGDGGD